MKATLLAAAALAAVATPAAARDNAAYVGLEVGAIQVQDSDVELDGENLLEIDHKLGVDGDLIAGYDFGLFRAEAELAYKRSHHDTYNDFDEEFESDGGRTSTYSGMINGMVDLGQDGGVNFYAGGGVGYAQVTHVYNDGDDRIQLRDRGLAWQLIAGVRATVSQYFDIGLKYRYFNAGEQSEDFDGDELTGDYKSHSLLFSLIHNFGPPPPPVAPAPVVAPPPPPPAPPATQTCPDGSVILATDSCPLLPPPPPPPAPEPERG